MPDDGRPDPDVLLRRIKARENGRGRLKIFFGMSAGVGKTYTMLKEAQSLKGRGEDIVIGWIEPHGRRETEELAAGIEVVNPKTLVYRGVELKDMDMDALLARKPRVALVDELAHSNPQGFRHPKRYQDVMDLLDAGIDVFTTVNIQHLESIADVVEELVRIRISERIPDSVFDRADDIQLVDLAPEQLIERLEEGKVYLGDKAQAAVANFFKRENLAILREIALRHASEVASHQLTNILRGEGGSISTTENARILVAVSASPNSEYLIRWTRRFAYALKATWTCLHVETGRAASEANKDLLARNLTLARNLGATVVNIPADNVHDAVLEYARQTGISILVIGKSGLGGRGIRQSLSDSLLRKSGNISVVAVQERESLAQRPVKKSAPHSGPPASEVILALTIIAAATLLGFGIIGFVGYWTAGLFFLVAINFIALFSRRSTVFGAAVLSAVSWDFFFIPPQYTFSIARSEDVFMLIFYFLLATTSSWFTGRLRGNQLLLKIRQKRMLLLHELSEALEEARGAPEAASIGLNFVSRSFDTATTAFIKDDSSDSPDFTTVGKAPTEEKEIAAAKYCFAKDTPTGRFTETLHAASFHYVPLAAPGGTIGVLGIDLSGMPVWPDDQESFLLTLSRTISLAVQRELLYEKNRKAMLVEESERLSRILLNSVSHELRTPLTVIQGSASSLLDEAIAGDSQARGELVREILSGAERLNNVVENLLSMNRLESGRLKLKIVASDPEEIISLAIRQVSNELDSRNIQFSPPDDLPLLFCDQVLIIQVMANLLQNAARYSGESSPIEIRIGQKSGSMEFTVLDRGPGVSENELGRLFEKFFRGQSVKREGTGLGLSICKAIVEAHGGTIKAANRPEGGLAVAVCLPLLQAPAKGAL